MKEQVLQWTPLGVAFALGLVTLVLKKEPEKERRSWFQWIIVGFYKAAWRFWVIVRAFDVGYLEYRRALEDIPFEIENERFLGKLIKPSQGAAALRKAA
jgi:hypothetical protein